MEAFLLGAGANGVGFVPGPRVSTAFEGDVAVYFRGETRRPESDHHESHAHDILARYRERRASRVSNGGDLGFLSGEFAVVVFDKLEGRVLAARDPNGAEPLFWGTANFGSSLLFSTDAGLLGKQCADADAFPAGTVFCSKRGEITGELTMLNAFGEGCEEERAHSDDEDVDFLEGAPLGDFVACRAAPQPRTPGKARFRDESSRSRSEVDARGDPGDSAA